MIFSNTLKGYQISELGQDSQCYNHFLLIMEVKNNVYIFMSFWLGSLNEKLDFYQMYVLYISDKIQLYHCFQGYVTFHPSGPLLGIFYDLMIISCKIPNTGN